MSVDLKGLIELEKLDREIARLENSKMEYPRKVTEMEATLLEKNGQLHSEQSKLEILLSDIRHSETALSDNKAALETSHDRLNLVKTNREYDAILLEISERKEMIEKDRKKVQKLSDKKGELEAEIAKAQEEYDATATELEPIIADLKSKIGSIDDDVAIVVTEREKVLPSVPSKYLEEYDRIRKNRKSGRTLSTINEKSNACGYCYQILNARIIKESQTSNSPVHCENCGSLVVWDPNNEKSEEN